MCNNRDIAKIESELRAIRKMKLGELDLKYTKKREIEDRIEQSLATGDQSAWCAITFEAISGPYTIVELTWRVKAGENMSSVGVARCWKRDKRNEKEGWRMAIKKAKRKLARKMAGLET